MATSRSYIKDGYPLYIKKCFCNDKPIAYISVINHFSFRQFPEIFDFKVIYRVKKDIRFYYYSESLGLLTNFPYDAIRFFDGKVIDDSFCIPNGSLESPYFDAGQGCEIKIFERYGYVFIMNGNGSGTVAESYYRVEKTTYYKEWNNVIEGLKNKRD